VRTALSVGGLVWVLAGLVGLAGAQPAGGADPVSRGRYLATIMACGDCHTGGALSGKPDPNRHLAGSEIGFGFPGGVVYPPNLTPDPETGLGNWTDAEILHAIRRGVRPDGRNLVPIMPWPSYAILTDDDARALVAYLRTLPPIRFRAPTNVGPSERPPAPFMTIVAP
jgi:mono/diheme cytochrome c family protein